MSRYACYAACLAMLLALMGCAKESPAPSASATPTPADQTEPTSSTTKTYRGLYAETPPPGVPDVLEKADSQIQVAEKMIDALSLGNFKAATANFDEKMQAALPEAKLREVWQTILQQSGSFQKRLESKKMAVRGYQVVMTNCQFEKQTLALQVTLDSQNRVSGFFIRPEF